MKSKIITAVVIVAVIGLIFVGYNAVCGYNLYEECKQRCTNERTSDEVLTEWLTEDKDFDIEAFKGKYKIDEITISSSDGDHEIPASYIYATGNEDKSGNTVIMVHGLLGNRLSNYPMSQMFLEQGFNVLTYDQRSSGGNTALYTTFGYLESNDTVDCANYLLKEMDENSMLGVWGQSMGAATVENAMDNETFIKYVDFVVLDSPMGNMENMIGGRGGFSDIQRAFASLFSKINIGFSYSDQNVYPQIENTKIPALVVCSKADNSIPFELEEKVYEALGSENKVLYTVDDSEHSDIFFDHPDEYTQKLKDFIKSLEA